MSKVINILESFVIFYFSWVGLKYYLGLGKLTEDKEQRRKERVEKYGPIIIGSFSISFACGLIILVFTLI